MDHVCICVTSACDVDDAATMQMNVHGDINVKCTCKRGTALSCLGIKTLMLQVEGERRSQLLISPKKSVSLHVHEKRVLGIEPSLTVGGFIIKT